MTGARMQPCRGCGVTFPYNPDADYCPSCAAENGAYAVVDGTGRIVAAFDTRADAEAYAALHPAYRVA